MAKSNSDELEISCQDSTTPDLNFAFLFLSFIKLVLEMKHKFSPLQNKVKQH